MAMRVFDLVPAIDLTDAAGTVDSEMVGFFHAYPLTRHRQCEFKITSMEGCGNNLFVGTSVGRVISFSLREDVSENAKVVVSANLWAQQRLPVVREVCWL